MSRLRSKGGLVTKQEAPPGGNPAARSGQDRRESGLDGVGSLAVLALGGRYSQAQFLADRLREKPAHAVRLPARHLHQFGQGSAIGTFQQIEDRRGFAAVTG